MNDQLKKLAAAAGAYTDVSGRWISSAGMQKFAEAIIRECAGIAHSSDMPSKDIKEHFGIEE